MYLHNIILDNEMVMNLCFQAHAILRQGFMVQYTGSYLSIRIVKRGHFEMKYQTYKKIFKLPNFYKV